MLSRATRTSPPKARSPQLNAALVTTAPTTSPAHLRASAVIGNAVDVAQRSSITTVSPP